MLKFILVLQLSKFYDHDSHILAMVSVIKVSFKFSVVFLFYFRNRFRFAATLLQEFCVVWTQSFICLMVPFSFCPLFFLVD